ITGFQGKDIVLVEDETGFEVPYMASEIVVIETDQYNFVRPNRTATKTKEVKAPEGPAPTSLKAALSAHTAKQYNDDGTVQNGSAALFDDDDVEIDIADKPMTFHARPLERRGADTLNLYLGYLPANTDGAFESYFINDSNYYVRYIILTQEGTKYEVRHEGMAEPNMKVFLEKFQREALPEFERMTIQFIAYKVDKTFDIKTPMSITLRLDGTKFYKLHTFAGNEFFDEPALIYDLVRDDQPARNVSVDAQQLQQALNNAEGEDTSSPRSGGKRGVAPARKEGALPGFRGTDRNGIIEIDLHVESLLDDTTGMDAKAILDYQLKVVRKTMEAHRKEKGRRIVFIHGKGDGVLRNALIKQLKTQYRNCTHQDASFQEYGFGATMVTVH
ncbi:MAG: DUF2027 domain-containing protein, partial [Bacteroidales bacterium]|nr:DUF2027 domain-containing protein [Bacteroidales bacterium]